MKKKNRLIYSILLSASLTGGLLVIQACSEDFLDKKPIADLSTANFYTTREDALAALNAAYDPLGWDVQSWGEVQLGDIVGGDADKGSTDDQDFNQILQMQNFNTLPNNSELTARWENNYQGIYRSNLILERVPTIQMDETLKKRILAEAKFLRALYYFYLVKAYGRVPIITKVLNPEEVFVERPASIAENWEQMEQDLTEAIPDLGASYSGNDVGRATSGAAKALLAKFYVFQSTPPGCTTSPYATTNKWQQAATLTDEIISSGQYDLVPDFASQFTVEGENNKESIFSIQSIGGTSGWHNENEGTALNQWISPRTKEFSGWGFSTPIGPNTVEGYGGNSKSKVNNIVEAFEPGDPRLKYTILQEGDTIYGQRYNYEIDANGKYTIYKPWTRTNYSIRKFLIPESQLAGAANSPLDLPVIRYADVLLWNAEAHNELGSTPKAIESLNKVRSRARNSAPNATAPADILPGVSQDQLRDIIIQERRVELAFEGHRFFDLVRTCRAEAFLNAMGRPFVTGRNELFPIPQGEVDRNPKLQGQQNPGY